jgi:hypothetical protein
MYREFIYEVEVPLDASIELLKKFHRVWKKISKLDNEHYTVFWDDVLTAMEERLRVLSHAKV